MNKRASNIKYAIAAVVRLSVAARRCFAFRWQMDAATENRISLEIYCQETIPIWVEYPTEEPDIRFR